MKFDTHCHLFSPDFAEAIARKTPYRFHVDRDRAVPFSSNSPDTGIQRTIAAIEAMDIPAEAKVKIIGGNAVTLLRKI